MEINEAFVLHSIGLPKLTEIARQAAGVDDLERLAWRVNQIGGGLGNPVSVGLYRVAGTGSAGSEPIPWSAILKVIQSPANVGQVNMGEGDDPTHWNYWKRELFVYRSGFLDTLPDGLVAPRCYATQELPGNVAWLWLEDVADARGDAWPLERYALAARHLGRLNGLYVSSRPLPDYPWLGRRRLRQWNDLFTDWRAIPWEHPQVSARYPAHEIANLRRMLLEAEDFIDRLDRLPSTVCHGDTYPTNFKSRDIDGHKQTLALDWALAQVGPVGYDLGGLAFGAYLNLTERGLSEVDHVLFEAYLAGLRDSGCRTGEQQVRFGYAASAALIISLFVLGMTAWQIRDADAIEIDATRPIDARPCFEAAMADIACELRDFV
jgi:hypothetical protein